MKITLQLSFFLFGQLTALRALGKLVHAFDVTRLEREGQKVASHFRRQVSIMRLNQPRQNRRLAVWCDRPRVHRLIIASELSAALFSTVVELRFFGGLSSVEAAETLGVSEATAKRDWIMARAWLKGELQ